MLDGVRVDNRDNSRAGQAGDDECSDGNHQSEHTEK
jgi:hypothetical protein